MSPDPGNAGAYPDAPQSWNAYSYVLNNPLNAIDPNGLDCVYLNDAGTGVDGPNGVDRNSNSGECSQNGGTWFDGTINSNSVRTDPNSDWVSAEGVTDSGLGSNQQFSCGGSSCSQDTRDSFATSVLGGGPATATATDNSDTLSPYAQQAAIEIHNAFAKFPNVCSYTFSANAGAPAGRMRVGVEYNTNTGFAARGRAQGGFGPVKGRVTMNSNGKVSTSIRVGGTYGVTVGLDGKAITSLGVSANLGKFVSAGVSAQIKSFYSCGH